MAYIGGTQVPDDTPHFFVAAIDYRRAGQIGTSGSFAPTVSQETAQAHLADDMAFHRNLGDVQIVGARIERICMRCNGTGRVRSARSKYKTVRCPMCRGKESTAIVETWIALPKSAWV